MIIEITKKEFDELIEKEEVKSNKHYFITDSKDLYKGVKHIGNLSDTISHEAKSIAELALEKAAELMKNQVDSEYKSRFISLTAEFDNYKKRVEREKAETVKTANEKLMNKLLSVIDDFERGLKFIKPQDREGVMLIYDKFLNVLDNNGVDVINPQEGEVFDESLHEVIATQPAEDESSKNLIAECVEKGYILNGKVIRYAKVVVFV